MMPATRRQRGYSLMELLVTMGLAAVLLGVGAGAFMSMGKSTAYREILASSAGLVSKARNASSRFPAAVVIDPEARIIYGRTEQILQELHFEPRPGDGEEVSVADGINGLTVDFGPGKIVPDGGRVGGGLELLGGVDCGNYAAYDVEDGVSIELWLKPSRLSSGSLVSKGDAFNVRVIASTRGESQIKVSVGVDDKGITEQVGGTVPIPDLRAGEWFGVIVSYDLTELTVSTDHGYGPVLRGRWEETRKLEPDVDAPLVIGASVDGVIDDFRFGGVHVEEPLTLPDGVEIDGPGRTIHFRGGKLDSRVHAGVEQVRLRFGNRITVLEIGQSGAVQELRQLQVGDDEATPEEESSGGKEE